MLEISNSHTETIITHEALVQTVDQMFEVVEATLATKPTARALNARQFTIHKQSSFLDVCREFCGIGIQKAILRQAKVPKEFIERESINISAILGEIRSRGMDYKLNQLPEIFWNHYLSVPEIDQHTMRVMSELFLFCASATVNTLLLLDKIRTTQSTRPEAIAVATALEKTFDLGLLGTREAKDKVRQKPKRPTRTGKKPKLPAVEVKKDIEDEGALIPLSPLVKNWFAELIRLAIIDLKASKFDSLFATDSLQDDITPALCGALLALSRNLDKIQIIPSQGVLNANFVIPAYSDIAHVMMKLLINPQIGETHHYKALLKPEKKNLRQDIATHLKTILADYLLLSLADKIKGMETVYKRHNAKLEALEKDAHDYGATIGNTTHFLGPAWTEVIAYTDDFDSGKIDKARHIRISSALEKIRPYTDHGARTRNMVTAVLSAQTRAIGDDAIEPEDLDIIFQRLEQIIDTAIDYWVDPRRFLLRTQEMQEPYREKMEQIFYGRPKVRAEFYSTAREKIEQLSWTRGDRPALFSSELSNLFCDILTLADLPDDDGAILLPTFHNLLVCLFEHDYYQAQEPPEKRKIVLSLHAFYQFICAEHVQKYGAHSVVAANDDKADALEDSIYVASAGPPILKYG